MPYKMRKLPNSDLYKVWNTETGEIHSNGSTLENAKKQIRLLHMVHNQSQGGEIEPIAEDQYTQEKGEAPYGTGVNHKGRKKGSKNKVKKLPKVHSYADEDYVMSTKFETPKSLTYDTTWRWVLRKEKELQGVKIPILMKEQALTDFYYALKDIAEEEEDEETMLDPYTDEDERVKRSLWFTIDWLDKNYMKLRNKMKPFGKKSTPKPPKEPKQPTSSKKPEDTKQRKLTDFLTLHSGSGLDITSLNPTDQHILSFLRAYLS